MPYKSSTATDNKEIVSDPQYALTCLLSQQATGDGVLDKRLVEAVIGIRNISEQAAAGAGEDLLSIVSSHSGSTLSNLIASSKGNSKKGTYMDALKGSFVMFLLETQHRVRQVLDDVVGEMERHTVPCEQLDIAMGSVDGYKKILLETSANTLKADASDGTSDKSQLNRARHVSLLLKHLRLRWEKESRTMSSRRLNSANRKGNQTDSVCNKTGDCILFAAIDCYSDILFLPGKRIAVLSKWLKAIEDSNVERTQNCSLRHALSELRRILKKREKLEGHSLELYDCALIDQLSKRLTSGIDESVASARQSIISRIASIKEMIRAIDREIAVADRSSKFLHNWPDVTLGFQSILTPSNSLRSFKRAGGSKSISIGGLYIRVVEGIDLAAKDVSGTSDPYCKLLIQSCSADTEIIWNELNPFWGEEFFFDLSKMTGDLKVIVFDKDLLTDDYLGEISIPLESLKTKKAYDAWYKLESKRPKEIVTGGIRLVFHFVAPSIAPGIVDEANWTPIWEYDSSNRLWVKRQCELYDWFLLSWDRPYSERASDESPCSIVPLDNSLISVGAYADRSYTFKLVHSGTDGVDHSYHFAVESAEELTAWTNALWHLLTTQAEGFAVVNFSNQGWTVPLATVCKDPVRLHKLRDYLMNERGPEDEKSMQLYLDIQQYHQAPEWEHAFRARAIVSTYCDASGIRYCNKIGKDEKKVLSDAVSKSNGENVEKEMTAVEKIVWEHIEGTVYKQLVTGLKDSSVRVLATWGSADE